MESPSFQVRRQQENSSRKSPKKAIYLLKIRNIILRKSITKKEGRKNKKKLGEQLIEEKLFRLLFGGC